MTELLNSDQLAQIAMNALEATAFVITDRALEVGEDSLDYCSKINVHDEETNVWLLLSATAGFLEELASSMLGLDPGEIDKDVEGPQALSEFANILGGEVIMALGGAERCFQMSLPEMANADELPVASTLCELESMGERFRVALA